MLAESIDSLLKNPRMDADTPWKNILDVYFRDFLELCLPDLEKKIDWKKGYVCLDKELHKLHHDSKVKGSVVDKLIKIWPIERNATWLLIHLEVQCSRDSHFPIRMFIYKYRIFDRYKVPIISIALLADGQSKWCPNYYREEIFGCHVEMRYLVIKVLDYLPQCAKLQKIANPFAKIILAQLVILATLRNPQHRLEKKVFLTRQLFNHGWDKNRIVELFKFIDWLIALPEDFKLQYHQATQQIEEEESMGYVSTAEWVGMKKGDATRHAARKS